MHRGQLRTEHLDRHLAVVLEVLGEIHGRHTALTQLPLDPVAVGESGRESMSRWSRSTVVCCESVDLPVRG